MTFSSRPKRFRSARLKVQRANRHIDELNCVLSSIDVRRFYSIRLHGQFGGPSTVILEPENPIPAHLPLMIGDAVHNLKSALDHVYTEIVGNSVPKRARLMPFTEVQKDITSGTRLDAVETVLAGSKKLILNEVQPYPGGCGNLFGLHTLDKIDKHNELVVTVAGAILGTLLIRSESGLNLSFERCEFNAVHPTVLYSGPEHVTLDHNFEASLSVSFDMALPFGGEPVIPTLLKLADRVAEVIELFDAL